MILCELFARKKRGARRCWLEPGSIGTAYCLNRTMSSMADVHPHIHTPRAFQFQRRGVYISNLPYHKRGCFGLRGGGGEGWDNQRLKTDRDETFGKFDRDKNCWNGLARVCTGYRFHFHFRGRLTCDAISLHCPRPPPSLLLEQHTEVRARISVSHHPLSVGLNIDITNFGEAFGWSIWPTHLPGPGLTHVAL